MLFFVPMSGQNHVRSRNLSRVMESLDESAKPRATKLSISLPGEMVAFIDEQCRAFGVGRSNYLQMLLDAEQEQPRRSFTKHARVSGDESIRPPLRSFDRPSRGG
jgi:hypothetical protein